MIAERYKEMLNGKSVIRELFAYATERANEIGEENVYNFSLGNPSVPVCDEFTKALTELLEKEDPIKLHGYSPTLGIPVVKKIVADSLQRRFGLPYSAEEIFMTSGAAGAIAHAVRAVTCEGEEVLTFAPFFPEYAPYVNATGAVLRIVPAETTTFQINFEKFEEMIQTNTAAVLVNSPNNPSGIVYSTETIKKLAKILEKKAKEYGHDIYIISDEPYREIIFQGVDLPCISQHYDNTIVCYSFSKSLSLPGERIGYVAVNPKCKDAKLIIQMCGQISRGIGHNCPSSLMQYGVAKVIDRTADVSVYEVNANILYEELVNLGFEVIKPNGTFYIFPKALEEDANVFSEKAKKYDLMLVPGDSFGCPGYFRIAYCVPTDKVIRSLNAFRKFVETEYPNR
jgi:aspartate aminotransferase